MCTQCIHLRNKARKGGQATAPAPSAPVPTLSLLPGHAPKRRRGGGGDVPVLSDGRQQVVPALPPPPPPVPASAGGRASAATAASVPQGLIDALSSELSRLGLLTSPEPARAAPGAAARGGRAAKPRTPDMAELLGAALAAVRQARPTGGAGTGLPTRRSARDRLMGGPEDAHGARGVPRSVSPPDTDVTLLDPAALAEFQVTESHYGWVRSLGGPTLTEREAVRRPPTGWVPGAWLRRYFQLPTMLVDATGRIVACNTALLVVTRCTREELRGTTVFTKWQRLCGDAQAARAAVLDTLSQPPADAPLVAELRGEAEAAEGLPRSLCRGPVGAAAAAATGAGTGAGRGHGRFGARRTGAGDPDDALWARAAQPRSSVEFSGEPPAAAQRFAIRLSVGMLRIVPRAVARAAGPEPHPVRLDRTSAGVLATRMNQQAFRRLAAHARRGMASCAAAAPAPPTAPAAGWAGRPYTGAAHSPQHSPPAPQPPYPFGPPQCQPLQRDPGATTAAADAACDGSQDFFCAVARSALAIGSHVPPLQPPPPSQPQPQPHRGRTSSQAEPSRAPPLPDASARHGAFPQQHLAPHSPGLWPARGGVALPLSPPAAAHHQQQFRHQQLPRGLAPAARAASPADLDSLSLGSLSRAASTDLDALESLDGGGLAPLFSVLARAAPAPPHSLSPRSDPGAGDGDGNAAAAPDDDDDDELASRAWPARHGSLPPLGANPWAARGPALGPTAAFATAHFDASPSTSSPHGHPANAASAAAAGATAAFAAAAGPSTASPSTPTATTSPHAASQAAGGHASGDACGAECHPGLGRVASDVSAETDEGAAAAAAATATRDSRMHGLAGVACGAADDSDEDPYEAVAREAAAAAARAVAEDLARQHGTLFHVVCAPSALGDVFADPDDRWRVIAFATTSKRNHARAMAMGRMSQPVCA